MHLTFLILLIFVAISGNAEETSSSLEITRPADKTLYAGENATFVIQVVSKQIDKIVIRQDNNKTTEVKIVPTKRTYCKTIKLHVGDNSIVISAYSKDEIVMAVERKLYFLSELFVGADDSEGYEKRYFHTKEKENTCKACHNMTSNVPTDGEVFEDVSQITCYDCHKTMLSAKNTHAPAANWLCLDCHDGKVGEYNMEDENATKYLVRDPVAKTCGSCHDTVEEWFANRYTHGPVNDGRCIRCHNPHGSDNEFFLRKHIWNLCTTCHSEKADGQHVVSGFVFARNKGTHPTKGPKDPARPGRELVCSSCHNPHGSSGIYLLRMKGSMAFGVCQRCHKK